MIYNIDEIGKEIGKKINKKRTDKKWSQSQLALECNLSEDSRQTVASWEKGTKLPTFDQMLKLCNIFNVEITYFLSDDCTNHNWEYIHQETGLSEPAIKELNAIHAFYPECLEIINDLIVNPFFHTSVQELELAKHLQAEADYRNNMEKTIDRFVDLVSDKELLESFRACADMAINKKTFGQFVTLQPDTLAKHYYLSAKDSISDALSDLFRNRKKQYKE